MKKSLLLLLALLGSTPGHAKAEHPELDAWIECLQTKGVQYATNDVSVETAATATMGACKTQEDSYRDSRFKTPFGERLFLGPHGINPEFVERARADHERTRQDFRERLVSLIVEARHR